tara:strand:- start:16 stop:174 length:159 start_codon:yes stop_codon:yes gene_type:complete
MINKNKKQIKELIAGVLKDFNKTSTNISSEAARLEIAKAIAIKLVDDTPVVQ